MVRQMLHKVKSNKKKSRQKILAGFFLHAKIFKTFRARQEKIFLRKIHTYNTQKLQQKTVDIFAQNLKTKP